MIEVRKDGTANAHVVAELLGVTAQRVRQLVREGVLPKVSRGRYPVARCVQAYVGFWQSRAEPSENGSSPQIKESKARKEAALAEKHEIDVRRLRGELVPVESVEDQIRDAVAPVDLGLRTAHTRLAPKWARRFNLPEGEALHAIRELTDELRGHLVGLLEGGDELPEGFPHRELLVAGGIKTLTDLRELEDLTEVHGIGPARAREIAGALS